MDVTIFGSFDKEHYNSMPKCAKLKVNITHVRMVTAKSAAVLIELDVQ